MRLFSGTLILMSLTLLVGCGGGGAAGTSNSDSNTAASTDPATDGNNSGSNTTPSPTPTPTPTPTGPQPGDLVASSEPDPNAQYPNLTKNTQAAPDPTVEPHTDYVVPVIAISSQPAAYIGTTSGTIELIAADNEGGAGLKDIQCNIDGAGMQSCDGTVQLTQLSEGTHTITAIAEDWDGNKSTEVSYTFYVDTTAPTVAIKEAPQPGTTDSSANFTFEGSDGGSGLSTYKCQLDDNNVGNCNDKESLENLSEGQHTMTVTAVDNVGNQSTPATYHWVVDHSAPIIDVVQQPSSTVYVGDNTPNLNFNVSDTYSPDGITTECTLNGKTISCPAGNDLNLPANQPADNTLVIVATDTLGNSSSTTIHWQAVNEAEARSTSLTVGDIRPVDILFVIDNSGSMNYERSNLAQRIDGMISVIDGLDWQIGVISTDSTNDNTYSDGRLVPFSDLAGTYILDSQMDVATAQSAFGNTVQNMPEGTGNEEGIYSSKRMIERYLAGNTNENQFIRPGADLSIVVLSDEDETSNGSNNRISPQGFVNFVNNSFNSQKNMVFHSIITRPGDSACLNGEGASYGNTYDELSRLTGYGEPGGAIIGSVCNEDYTGQLSDIGQSVKDLQNSIKLECAPFDINKDGQPDLSISSRADANSNYSTYNAPYTLNNDRVIFDDLLPPGDYKVDYNCKIN